MNDIIFSNSFVFRALEFDKFHHTDNRAGAPSHFFAYIISSRCKIVTASETIKINEGDIFYIPDKCSYQSYWYGNPKIQFIPLGFSYLPNLNNQTHPVQVVPYNKEAALYSAFQKSSDITPNQLRNQLLLEKAKDMLISTDKPIEYICDYLKFSSTSYFRKKFKQHFNTTPKEMRKRSRI